MFNRVVGKTFGVVVLASLALTGCSGGLKKEIQGNWELQHYILKDGSQKELDESDRSVLVISESEINVINLQSRKIHILKYTLDDKTITAVSSTRDEKGVMVVSSVSESQLSLLYPPQDGADPENEMTNSIAVSRRITDEELLNLTQN